MDTVSVLTEGCLLLRLPTVVHRMKMYLVVVLLALPTALYGSFIDSLSPKLQLFLKQHSSISNSFVESSREVLQTRRVQLYYFYAADPSVPPATHYDAAVNSTAIVVKENQEPLDECVCILFELINSTHESQFSQVVKKAYSGELSKSEFAKELLKIEFSSTIKVQKLLKTEKFESQETKSAEHYNRLLACPTKFDDYLKFIETTPSRNPVKEYESQYEDLVKRRQPSVVK
jgi:hypothetical protein